MLRTTAGIVLIALALGATVTAVAQDGVDIKVGNEIVARVRDTGQYGSVQARAEAINQAIGEALEGQDPAALEVSLKQVDGLWTVFIADKRIMSVLPAEAEANGMAPHVLGSIWVEKFKQALPSAQTGGTVTVVDLGNPLGDQPVTGTPTPTTTPTTTPATTGNVEVLEVPVEGPTPATGGAPAQPTVAAAQGARLLIIDAFNKIRAMPEDSYVRAREEKAGELLDNLLRVVSGGEMGAPEEPQGFVRLQFDDLQFYVSCDIWNSISPGQDKLLIAVAGYGRFWLYITDQHGASLAGSPGPVRD